MDLKYFFFVFCLEIHGAYSGGHGGHKHHEHIRIHVPEIHEHKFHTKYVVIHHHPAKKHHHMHHKPKIPNLHKHYSFDHHHHHKQEEKHHKSHHSEVGEHGDYGKYGDHHSYHGSEHEGGKGHHNQEYGQEDNSHDYAPQHHHHEYAPQSHQHHHSPQTHQHDSYMPSHQPDYSSYKPNPQSNYAPIAENPKIKGVSFTYKKLKHYETPGFVPVANSVTGPGYKVTEDHENEHSGNEIIDDYTPSITYGQSYKSFQPSTQHASLESFLASQPAKIQAANPDSEIEYSEEANPMGQYGGAYSGYAPAADEAEDLLEGYVPGGQGSAEGYDDGGGGGHGLTAVGGYEQIIATGGHQITEY